jgi:hypothetical protein
LPFIPAKAVKPQQAREDRGIKVLWDFSGLTQVGISRSLENGFESDVIISCVGLDKLLH